MNISRSENQNRNNKKHKQQDFQECKQTGMTASCITNRIQVMEDRISSVEDTIEETESLVKKKC